MRRRIAALLVLIALISMLTGCMGSRETDEIAYVLAIGLDKAIDEPKKIRVTYQIAVPRSLAGGPQAAGGKPEQTSVLITLKAENLAEARNLLKSTVSRIPIISHTKVIIIGEELARDGIGDIVPPLLRFREFRGSMYVMVVNEDTAENWLKKNVPKLELLPSRFYESTLLTSDETSYYIKTYLHNFYAQLKDNGISPYTVLGGLEEEVPPPANKATPPAKADEYIGNTPRLSDTEESAEMIGTAIFRKDKLVGKLTSNETRMFAIVTNQFRHGFYVVEDPLVPKKSVNVFLTPGEPVKTVVTFDNDKALIATDIFIEGEITAFPSGISYEQSEYRQLLEAQLSQAITADTTKMLSKLQRLGSDAAGFGYKARHNFTTIQEWHEFDWNKSYQEAELQVKVDVKIRRNGLLWKTTPTSKEP